MTGSNRACRRRPPPRLAGLGGALVLSLSCAVLPAAASAQANDRVGAPLRLFPGAGADGSVGQRTPTPAAAGGFADPSGVTIPQPPVPTAPGTPQVPNLRQPAPAVAPRPEPQPQPSRGTAGPQRRAGPGLETRALGALDAASVGSLRAESGGLPGDLWRDTPRTTIAALLARLPLPTASPAMASLARRLLLSQGAVANRQPGDPSGVDILGQRADRLLAGGWAFEAAGLLKLSPEPLLDPKLAQLQMNAALLAGDDDEACRIAEATVEHDSLPLWQKASAYCFARKGDREHAGLFEGLLREVGEKDPIFFRLLGLMLGRGGKPPELKDSPTPLELAMLRAQGVRIPPLALQRAPVAVLRAVAGMSEQPLAERLEVAERAAQVEALPLADLRSLYETVATTPEQRLNALATAASEPGAGTSALLWQAAKQAVEPRERALYLTEALANARRTGRPLLGARAFAPLFRQMQPTPAQADFAGTAGRALLAAGETAAAAEWFRIAVDAGRLGDAVAARQAAELWPLMQVADTEGVVEYVTDVPEQWWRLQLAQKRPERFVDAEALYTMLEVLGLEVPRRLWDALYAGPLTRQGAAPAAVLVRGIAAAGAAGRVGETVLTSLVLLGGDGPGGVPADALGTVVHALSAAGLQRDAAAIALEGLLARGF